MVSFVDLLGCFADCWFGGFGLWLWFSSGLVFSFSVFAAIMVWFGVFGLLDLGFWGFDTLCYWLQVLSLWVL